ncbi:hypothetical protein SLE2022_292540 [Rubroshorea leprosula]
MKKQGCEIEAVGINYSICIPKRTNHLRFFKINKQKEVDQELQLPDSLKVEKACTPVAGVLQVLKDVNCRAKPWEILAIVGPSGTGKSLLEILSGKLVPQSGSILINQNTVDGLSLGGFQAMSPRKISSFPSLLLKKPSCSAPSCV